MRLKLNDCAWEAGNRLHAYMRRDVDRMKENFFGVFTLGWIERVLIKRTDGRDADISGARFACEPFGKSAPVRSSRRRAAGIKAIPGNRAKAVLLRPVQSHGICVS